MTKVKRSPVSFFTSPHDLATEVTVSFVKQRERLPAVGFIRANQAPDLKKYADLLEENGRLHAELAELKGSVAEPFSNASDTVTLVIEVGKIALKDRQRTFNVDEVIEKTLSWSELFVLVAEFILYGEATKVNYLKKLSKSYMVVKRRILKDLCGQIECRNLNGFSYSYLDEEYLLYTITYLTTGRSATGD